MDFSKIALEEAQKSPCNKRKVGAVIVDHMTDMIKSRGHNYSPSGKGCETSNGLTKDDVVHAEISAIENLNLVYNAKDSYIYVTHPPCENCQMAIEAKGLKVKIVEQFMKFDSGKLQYSLIPPKAMREMTKVLTYGAKKYKPNNWQNVDDTTRYIDALYRHLEAWRSGEKIDDESKLSHLSHALTNVAFLIHFEDIQD